MIKQDGAALDKGSRQLMENKLGADFSDVRVHTDAGAADSAKAVGAHAYTVRNHVVFGQGKYDPGSADGQKTLAHELTHVVQQRNGPVDGKSTGDGVKMSTPGDRFELEAEHSAEHVMSSIGSQNAGPTPSGGAGGAQAMHVQRAEEQDGDETGSAMHVQRAEEQDGDETGSAMHVQRAEEQDGDETGSAMHVQRAEEQDGDETGSAMHVQRAEEQDGDETGSAMHVQRAEEAGAKESLEENPEEGQKLDAQALHVQREEGDMEE